jgi:alpha-beta hydrolase superfamily lysophospholipase
MSARPARGQRAATSPRRPAPSGPKTLTFPSRDGLRITADYYRARSPRGFIVLCHRSHFNRGEYEEIAPRLVIRGFSCLAIDQRSGMTVLGYTNETAKRAKQRGLSTGYLDARPDIETAIEFAFTRNQKKPLILLGSSYSASLALLLGIGNDKVDRVVAFSPGEYLKNVRVHERMAELSKRVFVTSSKQEIAGTRALIRRIPKQHLTHFKPAVGGAHGARCLWSKTEGHAIYWAALEKFLA